MADECRRGEYVISTDRERIDVDVVHAFLASSYWAQGISRDIVARSIDGALTFGIYRDARQVGGARVITDYATIGYVADVFVLEAHRGKGLGVWLMETIMAHPRLQGFRVWRLATRDAHGLYEKFGFRRAAHPENIMEILNPDVFAARGGAT